MRRCKVSERERVREKVLVEREVYDRAMVVFRNDRQTSNPEELIDAIFGHSKIAVLADDQSLPDMGLPERPDNPSLVLSLTSLIKHQRNKMLKAGWRRVV